jgi:hypothetical protein
MDTEAPSVHDSDSRLAIEDGAIIATGPRMVYSSDRRERAAGANA